MQSRRIFVLSFLLFTVLVTFLTVRIISRSRVIIDDEPARRGARSMIGNLHFDVTPNCSRQSLEIESRVEQAMRSVWTDNADIAYNHGGVRDIGKLLHVQSCGYASLERFKKLAKTLNLTRWSATAGSVIGIQCHNSILPWDDDVDLVMDNCSALRTLHESLPPGTSAETDFRFDGRQLDSEYDLFRFQALAVSQFKLRPRSHPPSSDIGGIDIDCLDRFSVMRAFGYQEYNYMLLDSDNFEQYVFGPVKVQSAPLKQMMGFIELNYPVPEKNPPHRNKWCVE